MFEHVTCSLSILYYFHHEHVRTGIKILLKATLCITTTSHKFSEMVISTTALSYLRLCKYLTRKALFCCSIKHIILHTDLVGLK